MSDLKDKIIRAAALKPKFAEPCNYCGWCCLTEVCQMGEYYGAPSTLPCTFLVSKNDNHYCELIINKTMKEHVMRIGNGCDAKTQNEVFTEYQEKQNGR